jgi:hypothetical protein
MIRNLLYSVFFIAILIMASCKSHTVTLQAINKRIDTIHIRLIAGYRDTAYTGKTYRLLKEYTQQEPADTNLSKTTMQLAIQMVPLRMYNSCTELLENIQKNYPQTKRAAEACFREGFMYANELANYDKAKQKYAECISTYSKIDKNIADDAKLELDNLGKSPDELFKEMQGRMKTDSIAKAGTQ